MKKYTVPAARFVTVWESSETVAEAAAKLKMSARAAGVRASKYRSRGVRLRKLKRSAPRISLDVAGLNEIVEKVGRVRSS